jgi:hypothetical protein
MRSNAGTAFAQGVTDGGDAGDAAYLDAHSARPVLQVYADAWQAAVLDQAAPEYFSQQRDIDVAAGD